MKCFNLLHFLIAIFRLFFKRRNSRNAVDVVWLLGAGDFVDLVTFGSLNSGGKHDSGFKCKSVSLRGHGFAAISVARRRKEAAGAGADGSLMAVICK